jgi:membrane dipeptidase
VRDLVDHVDYVVDRIGIDHVGLSSDFINYGFSLDGWRDASETRNVTQELVRRGYTVEEIGKIWSGNALRVWRKAEETAAQV